VVTVYPPRIGGRGVDGYKPKCVAGDTVKLASNLLWGEVKVFLLTFGSEM